MSKEPDECALSKDDCNRLRDAITNPDNSNQTGREAIMREFNKESKKYRYDEKDTRGWINFTREFLDTAYDKHSYADIVRVLGEMKKRYLAKPFYCVDTLCNEYIGKYSPTPRKWEGEAVVSRILGAGRVEIPESFKEGQRVRVSIVSIDKE